MQALTEIIAVYKNVRNITGILAVGVGVYKVKKIYDRHFATPPAPRIRYQIVEDESEINKVVEVQPLNKKLTKEPT